MTWLFIIDRKQTREDIKEDFQVSGVSNKTDWCHLLGIGHIGGGTSPGER